MLSGGKKGCIGSKLGALEANSLKVSFTQNFGKPNLYRLYLWKFSIEDDI